MMIYLAGEKLDPIWFDNKSPYLERDNMFDHVDKEKGNFSGSNELMIKDRIPPEYIQGIIVQSETSKNELLQYLSSKDILQKDEMGNLSFLGISIDRWLRVEPSMNVED